MTLSDMANIAQIISVLGLVVSVIFATRELKLLRLTHSDNHDWNRRKSAQDITMNLNNLLGDTEHLHKTLNIVNRVEPIPVKEVTKAIKEDPSIQLKINKVLNIYNSIARGVHNGVYDRDIIVIARKDAMIKTYNSFSSYIIHRRKESFPNLWEDIESLVNEWKQELTEKESRPIIGQSTKNK